MWHHVAGTYDGANVRLYIDGVEQGTGTATNISIAYGLPTSNDLTIGRYNGSCILSYAGLLDEIEIFNRALSPCGDPVDLQRRHCGQVQRLRNASGKHGWLVPSKRQRK